MGVVVQLHLAGTSSRRRCSAAGNIFAKRVHTSGGFFYSDIFELRRRCINTGTQDPSPRSHVLARVGGVATAILTVTAQSTAA